MAANEVSSLLPTEADSVHIINFTIPRNLTYHFYCLLTSSFEFSENVAIRQINHREAEGNFAGSAYFDSRFTRLWEKSGALVEEH